MSSYLALRGREPPLTTKTPGFAGCLDYLWLSESHFEVLQTLEMPYGGADEITDPDDVTDLPPLPDEHHPSDHIAMGCVVKLL